jgi:two-component system, response regulator, stage 0 sporulation protein A
MDNNIEIIISDLLLSLSITPNLKGYHNLKKAIRLVLHDYSYINSITTRLYPDIATYYETTNSQVERSIRHSIETYWMGNKNHIILGFDFDLLKKRPSNSQFISVIVEKLKQGMEELSI